MDDKLIKIEQPDLIRYSNTLVKRSIELLIKFQSDSVLKFKPRILLAINDDNAGPLFEEQMTEAGFYVRLCKNFTEIINYFQNDIFELCVITNLGLFPKDIPDVIQKLKLFNKKIPILVLSAFKDPAFIEKISDLGAESFFSLPIDFDDFIIKINEIIYFNISSKYQDSTKINN